MADNIYLGRVMRLVATGLAIELGLFLLAHFRPVFAPLVRVVYLIVALVFFFAVWRERRRNGEDRRRGEDRRQA